VGVRPANFNALVDGRFPHERTSAGRALKPVAGRADVECMTPLVWRSYLGAGVLAAGAVLLLPAVPESVLVMVPYFRDPELSLVELVVSLAYPVGDALLLALASALAVAGGKRVVAYWLLVGNLVVTLVADTAFSVLALRGADTAPVDAGYVIGYILLGAAALHPSMAALSEPAPSGAPAWAAVGCWRWAPPRWSRPRCWWSSTSRAPRSRRPRSPAAGRRCSCWSRPAWSAWSATWSRPRRNAAACSTGRCRPASRSASRSPPTSTTGLSSA
jgi:hypothetical protein